LTRPQGYPIPVPTAGGFANLRTVYLIFTYLVKIT